MTERALQQRSAIDINKQSSNIDILLPTESSKPALEPEERYFDAEKPGETLIHISHDSYISDDGNFSDDTRASDDALFSDASQLSDEVETDISTPWQILSDDLEFENDDHRFWWNSTGKVMADLLEKAGYETHLQYQFMSLYYQHIVPVLGPQPDFQSQPHWKSFLTDDFTPVEPSWNWDGSKSLIRFGIEPVSELAGSSIDPYNQLMTLECLHHMSEASKLVDLKWFNHFEDEFFLSPGGAETVRAKMPKGEHSSQSFLAFDLHEGDITTKAYFFPILKSLETGRSCADLIFDSIKRLDSEELRLKESLSEIEDYINEFPPDQKPRVEMIAVDCEEPIKSRIKVYVRMPHTAFNKVRHAYTLGGRLTDSSVVEGIRVLEELWPLLLDVPEGFTDDDELPANSHRTAGTIFNFEIRPNQPKPEPKIYIPVRHYGKSDLAICEGLSTFFTRHEWPDLAESYTRDIESIFPDHDLANSTGTHTYVSYSYKRSTGVALTMYFNPKLFSGSARVN